MMYEFHMGLMEIVSCAGVDMGQKLEVAVTQASFVSK